MMRHYAINCLLVMAVAFIPMYAAENDLEKNADANKIAFKTVSQNLGGYFIPSLQTKENAEAIQMPAIIFQRAFDYYSTELNGHTIEFNSEIEICNPKDRSPFFLRAHYFVDKARYQITIFSANPELGKINLTVPARGLSFFSDSNIFSVSNFYYTNANRSFIRPFGEPPPFEFMYGDYQLSQLRYADQDAQYRRKKISEIRDAYRLQIVTNRSGACEQVLTNSDGRYSTMATFADGKLEKLEFFADGSALDEYIEYEYSGVNDKQLTAETIVFPETTILAGFQGGKAMRVNVNDKAFEVKTFPLTFRRGGRAVKIKYDVANCDGLNLEFPKSIEIVCYTNGLRKANIQVSNFKFKAFEQETNGSTQNGNPVAKFSD